ncbi:MAG TPA: hypothetical protein DIC52_04675, partial [Candidatus Latescibacteria bacterium]|nr:hypothetical protein [Candidatus Latescibacterota bacterium]
MIAQNLELDHEDMAPARAGASPPKWQRNLRNILQYRRQTGEIEWNGAAGYRLPTSSPKLGSADLIEEERQRRFAMWNAILTGGGPKAVKPSILRDLDVYGGAVALLHTGSSYADDLAEDCVLYHYPATNRPPSRDKGEIDATKNAGRFGLPVFVISYPSPNSSLRDAVLAWVEGWNDDLGMFLVTFGEDQPDVPDTDQIDDSDFTLTDESSKKKRQATVREGQQRFQFAVFQRYGRHCAMCGITAPEVRRRPPASQGEEGVRPCREWARVPPGRSAGASRRTPRLIFTIDAIDHTQPGQRV